MSMSIGFNPLQSAYQPVGSRFGNAKKGVSNDNSANASDSAAARAARSGDNDTARSHLREAETKRLSKPDPETKDKAAQGLKDVFG